MGPPTLVILQENRAQQRHPVTTGESVIGRDPGSTLPVDDGYLSRKHCVIALRGEQVAIRDLGSYNGTYVNGQKIHEECFLAPGDVVKVGRTRLFVDWGEEDPEGESIRIHAPALEPRTGVRQIQKEKAPALPESYRKITDSVPSPPPAEPSSEPDAAASSQTRPQGHEKARPDDKTPIPPPTVEDSAIARSSSRAGSGLPRERGDKGMRIVAQLVRVLSNVRDPHEWLDYTLSRILEVVPAERGIIMLLDPARRSLYAECVRSALPDVDDQAARRKGISHTIARKVIRERVSVLVDDAVLDQRFKQASSVQELQVRSILAVPLWLGERVSGLIYLDHLLHAYAFTEADRDLLVAAANLAALGVERLRR